MITQSQLKLTPSVNLSLRLAELFVESCVAQSKGNDIEFKLSVIEEMFRTELTEMLPAQLIEPAMKCIGEQLCKYVESTAFIISLTVMERIPTTAGLMLFHTSGQVYIGLHAAGVKDDTINRVNPVTEPWTPRR